MFNRITQFKIASVCVYVCVYVWERGHAHICDFVFSRIQYRPEIIRFLKRWAEY